MFSSLKSFSLIRIKAVLKYPDIQVSFKLNGNLLINNEYAQQRESKDDRIRLIQFPFSKSKKHNLKFQAI